MAITRRGDRRSGSRPGLRGRPCRWRKPEPGGWNRFVIEVEDLESQVGELRAQGVPFRNEIVTGPGGRQILCEDPSGNVVELFQRAG